MKQKIIVNPQSYYYWLIQKQNKKIDYFESTVISGGIPCNEVKLNPNFDE